MNKLLKFPKIWATVVGLGILLTSDSLLASTSRTCVQNCQAAAASELKNAALDIEQFFLDPSKMVCTQNMASYEYQDWYDWKPQIINAVSDRQVASFTSAGGQRNPARSNN